MSASQQSMHQHLESLYHEHHGWLRAWLFRRLTCRNDAEDLTQDTFVQVMKAETAAEINSPKSYLATIAKSLTINLFRRRSIEQSYLQSLEILPEQTAISPEKHHETIETLIEIDTALSGLSPRIRRAFLLSRLEGLTYKCIAERLSVSERTIKNYMAQAMLCCLVANQTESDSDSDIAAQKVTGMRGVQK